MCVHVAAAVSGSIELSVAEDCFCMVCMCVYAHVYTVYIVYILYMYTVLQYTQ